MVDFSDIPDVGAEIGDGLADLDGYLREELELIRRDPQEYGHPPHEGQVTILENETRRKCIVSANRWGKSEIGMRDTLWRARCEHPFRDVRVSSQIWVGAPDYPSYLRFHLPAFEKWCPPSWIVGSPPSESKKHVDIKRVGGGTCRIFFLSYDMPRSKWQGAGVDHIWLDEEMPEDIVRECLARIVTTRGSIMLTFTPVEGVGWWYDAIFDPGMKGTNNWWCFQAALATRDELNEAEYEVGESLVPHLTREQIVEFASEYPDPDERAIRVFGAVKGRTGLVYKGYSRDIHKVPAFQVTHEYEMWGAVDPGYHGFAAGIVAISPQDRAYVVDEFFSQQETTAARFRALMEKVRAIRPEEDWRDRAPVVVFFVDTEDPQVVLELNIQAAISVEEDIREGKAPVYLSFASLDQGLKARKAGFLRVQQMLDPKQNRKTPFVTRATRESSTRMEPLRERPEKGEPQLYFFDTLHTEWQGEDQYHRESRVLWEIERYSWKKPPKGSTITPDDGDENTAGGAHAMAWLRYFVMGRLGPPGTETQDDEDRRKRDDDDTPEDRVLAEIREDIEELDRIQTEQLGLL